MINQLCLAFASILISLKALDHVQRDTVHVKMDNASPMKNVLLEILGCFDLAELALQKVAWIAKAYGAYKAPFYEYSVLCKSLRLPLDVVLAMV